ncbi:hypothetical protein MC885_000665 [Smutsia gigantea]|nr:hypothetical protein MC885_000665 [Smutsia gigantea]
MALGFQQTKIPSHQQTDELYPVVEHPSKQRADSLCHPLSDYFWIKTLEVCTGFDQPGLWLPDTKRYLVFLAGPGRAILEGLN